MQYVLILADITDFAPDGPLQGLSHSNGALQVLQNGTYYIYAQAFFEDYEDGDHRLKLIVNGEQVSVIQNPYGEGSQYGNRFTGLIKKLYSGDYIGLRANSATKLWMETGHTFFGAIGIGIE